jgi:[acyl-carrier-protein] S-malonyltransferase
MTINPYRTAFIFPGQGSQELGMGRSLAEVDPSAAKVFQQADEILGYPLTEICWNGPEDDLNDTFHTQPALLSHSTAVLEAFRARFPSFKPAYTAGHSLGEYTALVASGALTFYDALTLVQERGRAMKAAGEFQPGGMAAVLGMELELVEATCREVTIDGDDGVWIANDNCPGQVVISGHEAAITRATERLLELGARKVIRLAVSIASHSPLMEPALMDFNQTLHSANLLDPQIPTIGNVEASILKSASDVRRDLNAQLTARVRWTETIRSMIDAGVDTFIEFGPKSVLADLLRRINRTVKGLSLDAPESFKTLGDLA